MLNSHTAPLCAVAVMSAWPWTDATLPRLLGYVNYYQPTHSNSSLLTAPTTNSFVITHVSLYSCRQLVVSCGSGTMGCEHACRGILESLPLLEPRSLLAKVKALLDITTRFRGTRYLSRFDLQTFLPVWKLHGHTIQLQHFFSHSFLTIHPRNQI
ncbi:hypothetical protein J6590_026916 [Homalodisca vitripennis]|nr:hypothetical protein J6590_026916 [Homalodisca vitripennis]